MKLKERLTHAFSAASAKTKRTYNKIRLNMKIKTYESEIEQLKLSIGEAFYSAGGQIDKIDINILTEHFEDIKMIENRLARLNKQKTETRKESKPLENEAKSKPETPAFIKLRKKDNDLRIGRASGEISVLRCCAKCGASNNEKAEKCEQCSEGL